jgi:hypothetical protein
VEVILKQTGSYELAAFALQDTTQAVMRHCSRFAASEKPAVAADILNQIWGKPKDRRSRRRPKPTSMQHHAQNGRYTHQAGAQVEVDGHVYTDKSEANSLSWPISHIRMMALKGNSISRFHGDGRETYTMKGLPSGRYQR